MPKCFINTARNYKTGSSHGKVHDPNVMTTRSGLSIKKVGLSSKPGPSGRQTPAASKEERERPAPSRKKPVVMRYKSLSYLSFVTRFHLCLRVPDLDMAGVNPKESIQYSDAYPFDDYDDDSDDDDGNERDNEYEIENQEHFDTNDDAEKGRQSGLDKYEVSLAENINNNEATDGGIDANASSQRSQFSSTSSDFSVASLDSSDGDGTWSFQDGFFNVFDSNKERDSTLSKNDRYFQKCLPVFANGEFDSEDASSVSGESYVDVEKSPLPRHSNGLRTDSFRFEDGVKFIIGENGRRLIRCQICDHVFNMMTSYASHLHSHVKEKNRCYICGKVFTRTWLLKGHLRTHTGEKPFPCPHEGCDKAFADKSNLRSHMMIHTNIKKSYTCQKCGRSFAQKRYLYKHMLEVCRLV